MKLVSILPGAVLPAAASSLAGSVLARSVLVGDERWVKGRLLTASEIEALAGADVSLYGPWADPTEHGQAITLLVPEPGDVHEDAAALRLAAAVAGPGLVVRGPSESRIDLVAAAAGAVRVRVGLLERVNRIDGLGVFSVIDGQLVESGALVASVKTGPHLVREEALARAEALASRAHGIVAVSAYRQFRVAAVVKEMLALAARARFEAALRTKVEAAGSVFVGVRYVHDDPQAVEAAFRALLLGSHAVDLLLTAGAASTDPSDAIFRAFEAVGGRIVSHGVPAHPGSMLWLGRAGRAGRTTFLGLPTCGAYSRATAADILLPWLFAGERPSRALVARLAHGGILGREMRFRFPAYARDLDAPEG